MRNPILALLLLAGNASAEIAPEPAGVVRSLPFPYPDHWVIAQDISFFHMLDGKFIVIDADSDDPARRLKGMFDGSFVGQFAQAGERPEFYVAETFYSRGHRGDRTDVLTIYDARTLAPVDEVLLPPKRASSLPTIYHVQLVDGDTLALVYNFTPAASVSVVDLEARAFRGEVPIPGCALVYPMAGRRFASLCADGTLLRVELDSDGAPTSAQRTEVFFDADRDPLIEKPAIIDGVAYFPSFLGKVVAIDLNGPMPAVLNRWSLVEGIDGGWRPGGIALTGSDAKGRLYVLMHPEGRDGSHKDPGTEVWVVDPQAGRLVSRIPLAAPAVSLGLTRDADPLLLTTNMNMEIDVYDADEGTHLRTIGNFGQETPLLLHGVQAR